MYYDNDPINPGDDEYILTDYLRTSLKIEDIQYVIIYLGLDDITIITTPYFK